MFGYLRLFSLVSLLVIMVIAIFAGMSFRRMALDDIVQLIEANSKSQAQSYINDVWKRHRDVVVPLSTTKPAELRSNPQVLQFAQETVGHFQHMSLVRVNIYNGGGMLLMSVNGNGTDKLAGNTVSPDKNFVAHQLRQSQPVSNTLHPVALQNNPEAALVQTMMPIRTDVTGEIDGALELISDMSPAWKRLWQVQLYGTAGAITIFLVFLSILILTSKKAENIIAKQHEANLELAATAAAAQAENREKSQFLANVSHELRTPLNAVIGFSDIIKNEVIAPLENRKYHDYINDIHSSGVHLLSLINDILDYSKAEAGKLEMEVSEINATKLIQNSMRLVSPRAESAKVKLTEEMPKDPLIMLTDSKKFKQILLNLLSNAVKFTPAGGEVSVTAWKNAADDTFSFEVSDTGIGIAPKDISRAMSPFGQVDSALSRKYEGTGLGLPLTKKFVELMGGKFTIESEVNVGTTIVFTLPRELKESDGLIIKYLT